MVHADSIRPGFVGENVLLYLSPHYHLYFMKEQKEDEVYIFKQFDSKTDVSGDNRRAIICFLELYRRLPTTLMTRMSTWCFPDDRL